MDQIKALLQENKRQFVLFVLIASALMAILMGILVWKLPVLSVCMIVLLEAGITICLQRIPVWQHGIMLAAQIILGVVSGKTLFFVTCAVFYVICILALNFCRK